jgi:hypothetical protein
MKKYLLFVLLFPATMAWSQPNEIAATVERFNAALEQW